MDYQEVKKLISDNPKKSDLEAAKAVIEKEIETFKHMLLIDRNMEVKGKIVFNYKLKAMIDKKLKQFNQ